VGRGAYAALLTPGAGFGSNPPALDNDPPATPLTDDVFKR
jgi:hypothetical protein